MSSQVDAANPEVHEYQAEMKQVLQILVHSLYTEREIFLRELVSNASDALSKIHFTSLTDDDMLDKDAALEIKVSYDETEKVITIEDTGIGMTHDEVVANLGTIASSGTLKFLKELKSGDQKPETLIGQFGVGFYSAFMVAEKVVFETRSYQKSETTGWQWSSDGSEKYTLTPIEKPHRGTRVHVHLKEDAHEFCNQFRIESIIKKYSNYLPFPVIVDEKTVNQVKAIWSQPKSEVSSEDYEEFYKQLSHEFRAPLHHLHLSIDAPIQYYGLLYIPEEITNEVLYAREGKGMSLYAQRVFIQEDNKDLLPTYLRFVRGIVDSEDIPLNVSRESVQRNALVEKIKKSLTSRVIKEFQSLSESNVETYQTFWKQYGVLLKEGVTSDFSNRDKLVELLRFNSSLCEDDAPTVSLKDYVARMRDDQKEIYYVVGTSRTSLQHNPNLEYFKEKGFEVLFLTDPIDDFLVTDLKDYQEKVLKDISQSDAAKEASAENEAEPLSEEDSKNIIALFKESLGDKVADVTESKRLVGSPCSLVSVSDGMSAHMERMMKSVNKDFQSSKRNLELNLKHPIIQNMAEILKKDEKAPFLKDCVEQLFNNVLMVEGVLENPLEMLPLINQFIEAASEHHLQK